MSYGQRHILRTRTLALSGSRPPLTSLHYLQLTGQLWAGADFNSLVNTRSCLLHSIQILKLSTGEKYNSQDQDLFLSLDSHESC